MTAADLYSHIKTMKSRQTVNQWLILVTLLNHPEGLTCNEVYASNWCGRENCIRKTLTDFAKRGLVTREQRPQPKLGRPFIVYKPTPKAAKFLGLDEITVARP